MARNSRKKNGIAVDFSNTESTAMIDEGDYLLEVDDIEVKTSDNSGADYLALTFKVVEGPFKGKKLWHNCSLQPQALFNLRGVLEALGYEVPQGAMELDPADLIGEQCAGAVQHEVYEGKNKARIVEFFTAAELDADDSEEEEEEEAPAKPAKAEKPAKGKGKKAKPAPEPEEEEDEDEEDEEEEEEAPPAKASKKGKGKAKPAPEPEEDEEEEEEVKPAPKKGKKGKKAKTITIGTDVTFVDDEGEVLEGSVTALDGDDVTVEVDDEEWELSLEDLTVA